MAYVLTFLVSGFLLYYHQASKSFTALPKTYSVIDYDRPLSLKRYILFSQKLLKRLVYVPTKLKSVEIPKRAQGFPQE